MPTATGVHVRDFHESIKGELPGGDRYHALQPETFWWAHATFQRMVDRLALYWDRHRLTDEQSEQLYAEGCEWYRRYGMSGNIVPPDRAAFEREVERYCREVLVPNPASDYLIEFINRRSIPDMSASPDYPTHPRLRPLTNALLPTMPVRMALAPPMRLVIFGGLPAFVRDRFGIRVESPGRSGDIEPSVPPSGRRGPTCLRRSGGIPPPARAGFANRDARPHGSEVSAQFTLGAENSMKKLLGPCRFLGVAIRRVNEGTIDGPLPH